MMKFRKLFSAMLSAVFLISSMGMAAAATPETVQDKLAAIEKDTYGVEQTGALVERINKLEKNYDGTHRTGSMMARVDAIYDEVYTNSTQPSILTDLNAIEWNINHQVSMSSVEKRIADMEMSINGKRRKELISSASRPCQNHLLAVQRCRWHKLLCRLTR